MPPENPPGIEPGGLVCPRSAGRGSPNPVQFSPADPSMLNCLEESSHETYSAVLYTCLLLARHVLLLPHPPARAACLPVCHATLNSAPLSFCLTCSGREDRSVLRVDRVLGGFWGVRCGVRPAVGSRRASGSPHSVGVAVGKFGSGGESCFFSLAPVYVLFLGRGSR